MMKLQAHLQRLPEDLSHLSGLIDPPDLQDQDPRPGELQAQDDHQPQGEQLHQVGIQMVIFPTRSSWLDCGLRLMADILEICPLPLALLDFQDICQDKLDFQEICQDKLDKI